MAAEDTGPLDWRIPITDKTGRPTPEFQRRWNTQRNNNALIGNITFGSGPPPNSPSPSNGAQYADVNEDPVTIYIGYDGVWEKAGVTDFTELDDVPNSYIGKGDYVVTVNATADGLTFKNPATLIPSAANPSAVAGPTANNGVAFSYMRSDATPAVQITSVGTYGLSRSDNLTIFTDTGVYYNKPASTTDFGVVKVDGTSIISTAGVLSSPAGGAVGANPTGTASATATNGSALTFMRSDATPAVQVANSSTLGLVRPDNTTITISSGIISAVGGGGGGGIPANPTATAGPSAINGVATTYMRSDAAPAVQTATTSQLGLVKPDGTSITISGGVISSTGGGGGGGLSPDSVPYTTAGQPGWDPDYTGFPGGSYQINLSNSNTRATPVSGGPYNQMLGTPARYTGKLYYEFVPSQTSFSAMGFTGAAGHLKAGDGAVWGSNQLGQVGYYPNGDIKANRGYQTGGVNVLATMAAWNNNDRLAFAFDLDAGLFWIKNLTTASDWNGNPAADPATGVGGLSLSWARQGTSSTLIWPGGSGSSYAYDMFLTAANQTGTLPSGFSAWA